MAAINQLIFSAAVQECGTERERGGGRRERERERERDSEKFISRERERRDEWMNERMDFILRRQWRKLEVCLHPALAHKGQLLNLQVNLRYIEYTIKHTHYTWTHTQKKCYGKWCTGSAHSTPTPHPRKEGGVGVEKMWMWPMCAQYRLCTREGNMSAAAIAAESDSLKLKEH